VSGGVLGEEKLMMLALGTSAQEYSPITITVCDRHPEKSAIKVRHHLGIFDEQAHMSEFQHLRHY
jgi:hypothetical protein